MDINIDLENSERWAEWLQERAEYESRRGNGDLWNSLASCAIVIRALFHERNKLREKVGRLAPEVSRQEALLSKLASERTRPDYEIVTESAGRLIAAGWCEAPGEIRQAVIVAHAILTDAKRECGEGEQATKRECGEGDTAVCPHCGVPPGEEHRCMQP